MDQKHPAAGRPYVSSRETPADAYTPGDLLCADLATGAVVRGRDYDPAVIPSPGRFDVTPDGAEIYLPVGENGAADDWAVIDAATGDPTGAVVHHTTSAHNTVVSLDSRYAFPEGQEKSPEPEAVRHTIAVVDTATDTVVGRVGPFRAVARPFMVNGAGTLAFANVNNFVGFQGGDVRTGKALFYTAAPPGDAQPTPAAGASPSHGIALTPDERRGWVADGLRPGPHVWDVSGLPARRPEYLGFVPTRPPGEELGRPARPGRGGRPGPGAYWVTTSYDGRYVYAETGEVVDPSTLQVVGQLRSGGPAGLCTHSRFMLEVDFDSGLPLRTTDQFGVGRVR